MPIRARARGTHERDHVMPQCWRSLSKFSGVQKPTIRAWLGNGSNAREIRARIRFTHAMQKKASPRHISEGKIRAALGCRTGEWTGPLCRSAIQWRAHRGAAVRRSSSTTTNLANALRACPPYSVGRVRPSHPFSPSSREKEGSQPSQDRARYSRGRPARADWKTHEWTNVETHPQRDPHIGRRGKAQ